MSSTGADEVIGEIRASLYDLFGYLLPGFVMLTTCGLAFDLLADPGATLNVMLMSSSPLAVISIITAYLLGHLAHALGNVLPLYKLAPEVSLFGPGGLPEQIVNRARERLAQLTCTEVTQLSPSEQFALIDEARILQVQAGDRDVYVYREGFYRGMSVSAGLLAIILVLHAVRGKTCFQVAANEALCAQGSELWSAALIGGAAALGYFIRMRRFGRYRVQRGLYQFVVAERPGSTQPHS